MIPEQELNEIDAYVSGFFNPFHGCCCGSGVITTHECKIRSDLATLVQRLTAELREAQNPQVETINIGSDGFEQDRFVRLCQTLNLLGVPLQNICLEWGMFDERGRQNFHEDVVNAIKIGEPDLVKHYLHNSGTQFCGATFKYTKGDFTVHADGSVTLGDHQPEDVLGVLGLAIQKVQE